MEQPARAIASAECPAGVRRGHDGAGADASDAMERNTVPLQNPEYARVSDAAGEPAAQGKPDSGWAYVRQAFIRAGEWKPTRCCMLPHG